MRVEVSTQDHLEVVRAHGAVHGMPSASHVKWTAFGPWQHGRVRGEDGALGR
jgi:hypothetical protein